MNKVFLALVASVLALSLSTVGFAAEKKVKAAAAGQVTYVDYVVTSSDSQMVTFSGLSPYSSYRLKCYPDSGLFASDVYVTVWEEVLILSGVFGGYSADTIEFKNLVPYRHSSGTYDMQYEISTDSMFTQRGYCTFR